MKRTTLASNMAELIRVIYDSYEPDEAQVRSHEFIQEQLTFLLTEAHKAAMKDAKDAMRLAVDHVQKEFEARGSRA